MLAKAGVQCFFCDETIETTDLNQSPVELAEQNGWAPMVVNNDVAFICPKCQRFFLF